MTNIKNLICVALIATLGLSFGACNDHSDSEGEVMGTSAPVIRASVGNDDTNTRAGVVEENNNYKTEGEKFYWTSDDKMQVVFTQNHQSTYIKYDANITNENEKKNTCDFTFSPDNWIIPPTGINSVIAYFPREEWDFSDIFIPSIEMPRWFYQTDLSSKHLGKGMFMVAKNDNVNVTGTDDSFDLNFEHLTAVFRIRLKVWDKFLDNNSIDRVVIGMGSIPSGEFLAKWEQIIPTKAEYVNGKLTPVSGYETDSMSVVLDYQSNFTEKIRTLPAHTESGKTYYLLDLYIPMLPFDYIFDDEDGLYMKLKWKHFGFPGFNDYTYRCYTITETAPGLANGVRAGYSYSVSIETPQS